MRQRRPWPRRFNFEAPYNRKEAMGALVAQGIIQLFLLIALIILFVVSLRMMASPACVLSVCLWCFVMITKFCR